MHGYNMSELGVAICATVTMLAVTMVMNVTAVTMVMNVTEVTMVMNIAVTMVMNVTEVTMVTNVTANACIFQQKLWLQLPGIYIILIISLTTIPYF